MIKSLPLWQPFLRLYCWCSKQHFEQYSLPHNCQECCNQSTTLFFFCPFCFDLLYECFILFFFSSFSLVHEVCVRTHVIGPKSIKGRLLSQIMTCPSFKDGLLGFAQARKLLGPFIPFFGFVGEQKNSHPTQSSKEKAKSRVWGL